MPEGKKFVLDKETLETQRNKLNDMIDGDKEAIAKNNVIAKDPNHVLDNQGEWAEARQKDNIEALNRHEQQLAETIGKLNDLSCKP